MKLLAADLSLTGTGVCVAADGKVQGYGLLPGRGEGVRRLIHVRNLVCQKVDDTKPDLVMFEDFSFGSSDGKAFERAGLAYMIRAELVADGVPFGLCSPSSLKKFVIGTAGNAKQPMKKEHMLKYLATRFGHAEVNDNNICDAIGLAYVGMALVGEWEPQIQAQKDVIEKLRATNPGVKSLWEVRA